jgi:MFS family permease
MMATTIPRVLLMSLGGVIADRFSRIRIICFSNVTRSLLILGMIGFLISGKLNITLLTVFALFFGILDAFLWPANQSIISFIVPKQQLTQANSIMQGTNQLTMIIGPFVAGIILATYSFEGVFSTIYAFLLIASFLVSLVRCYDLITKGEKKGIFSDLVDGFRYVWEDPLLLTILGIAAVANFFLVGPLLIGIPMIVDELIRGNAIDLSWMQSSVSFGMMVSSFVVGALNLRKKRGLLMLVAIGFSGIWLVFMSLITELWQGVILLFLTGLLIPAVNIPLFSILQEKSDPDKIGRVMSLVVMVAQGLTPLSFGVISAVLALGIHLTTLFLICGSFIIAFTFWILWKRKEIRMVD